MEDLQPSIDTFIYQMAQLMGDRGLGLRNLYNMDQTAIFFDMPPNYTVVERGTRHNTIATTNNEKNRVSVLLFTRGDGVKCTPLIVYKGTFNGRVSREVKGFDDNRAMHVAQDKAWTNYDVLNYWRNRILMPVFRNAQGPKVLLVDSLKLHKNNEQLLKCNANDVIVRYVPEYCTSILQPLGVGVIKIFKQKVRQQWLNHMLNNNEVTRRNVSDWVKTAWNEI